MNINRAQMPTDESTFCINCGSELPGATNYCPDCGSSQQHGEIQSTGRVQSSEQTGFTSWAIGFKPGSIVRNVLVAALYVLFHLIGVPLLIYAYIKSHPHVKKYFAWIGGIAMIFFSFGPFTEGSGVGILAGIVCLSMGLLFLPIVRKKSGIKDVPGINRHNSERRNILTGVAYGIAGLTVVSIGTNESSASSQNDSGISGSSSSKSSVTEPSDDEDPRNLLPESTAEWERSNMEEALDASESEIIEETVIAEYFDSNGNEYSVMILRYSSRDSAEQYSGSLVGGQAWSMSVLQESFEFLVRGSQESRMIDLLSNAPTLSQEQIVQQGVTATPTPTPVPNLIQKVRIVSDRWEITEISGREYKDDVIVAVRNDSSADAKVFIKLVIRDSDGNRITGFTKDWYVDAESTEEIELRPEGSYGDFESATYEVEIIKAETS